MSSEVGLSRLSTPVPRMPRTREDQGARSASTARGWRSSSPGLFPEDTVVVWRSGPRRDTRRRGKPWLRRPPTRRPRLLASKVFEVDMGRRRQIKRAILLTACALPARLLRGRSQRGPDQGRQPGAQGRRRLRAARRCPGATTTRSTSTGHANLINTEGGTPTALEEMRLDFDRDGKLEVRGLPVCPVGRIAHATVGEARRKCADAIVGTGHVGAIFDLFGLRRPGHASRRPSSTARARAATRPSSATPSRRCRPPAPTPS